MDGSVNNLIQLFKECSWLADRDTDSEAYNKNGKQYALSNSTVTISDLAALEREYIQLKTRKNLTFVWDILVLKWLAATKYTPKYFTSCTYFSSISGTKTFYMYLQS